MPETLVAQVRVGGEHLDVDNNLTDRRRTRILEIEQDVATDTVVVPTVVFSVPARRSVTT